MEKKTEDAQSSSDASQGTWTGWGWNMVESVGKTITRYVILLLNMDRSVLTA